jgi:predicted kinase
MSRTSLFVTVGFPGSGKNYFSERLAQKLDLFHMNADKTRLAMFDDPQYTPEEHRQVFRTMDFFVEELLKKDVSVVYDGNFNKRIFRKKLADMAGRVRVRYVLVWLQTELSVALSRIEDRKLIRDAEQKKLYRPLDPEIVHRMKREMEVPTQGESPVVIDGHLPFDEQFKTLEKYLV